MKILTILGARPQFIKASALSREFKKYPEIIEIIIHTGQHFDKNMSEVFFTEMNIPIPKYNLNINGLSHGAMTGQMIQEIEKIILLEKPDFILVYGDTNSTLAGALAAAKLNIKIIHVEAGLRSFNMNMPEEINRILTDRLSYLLFCPTESAVNNLNIEGFNNFKCKVFISGDVMKDNALYFSKIAEKKSTILSRLNLNSKNYLLCTIHRAENTDKLENLKQITKALNKLSNDFEIILPLHPRTKNIIESNKLKINFHTIEPVGYLDMLQLIKYSNIVLTDSGGLQKEAYFFNTFCITMRDETEWTELIENGCNILTGANSEKIISSVQDCSKKTFPNSSGLYGNGNSAEYICNKILLEK
ncbi:MAG: UDP-N-acetylglucosamine 2-epimerase (non-hydrolyzing) [Bacteroidales bacterium]|nr:UDP-N-acetylglucosamine 2-epimerase (non-hydrolyzing) [Bacteroidales bacterium]